MGVVPSTSASERRSARGLRAYLADVGAGIDVLPWRAPREAERWLEPRDREALSAFRRRVGASFLAEAPHLALAEALAGLDPDQAIAAYPGAPPEGTRWFAQTFDDRARASAGAIANHAILPRVRLYELDRVDPFADRPVGCGPLFAGATTGNDPLGFVEGILLDNGLFDQLRMVIYEGARAELFVGFYREQGARRFDSRDHAMLLAARPALRAWGRAAAAVGVRPLGDGALASALDALATPALLLRNGRVLHANRPGRARVDDAIGWHRAGRPAGFASVTRLRPGGLDVELVLPVAAPAPAPTAGLPPSLAAVASLLARGASDKEVAAHLGLTPATARTYVARVLRRVGARDRRALIGAGGLRRAS